MDSSYVAKSGVTGATQGPCPALPVTFTPGPWQVQLSHIYTADPERALICQVLNSGSQATDFPIEANARLIAASPELLEALEIAAAVLGKVRRGSLKSDAIYAWGKAKVAIAKAAGGT